MMKAIRTIGLLLLAVLLALPCAALADYSMPVADGDLDAVQGLDENWFNVLLIGTDSREKNLRSGRADTMMICAINTQTGEIKITSLARDTWVTIGDNGHQNKLNAAHTFGGPNLLMQTINRTYSLNIEHYITINFYGVCDIVDALGGVHLELAQDEAWAINTTVEEEYSSYGSAQIKPLPRDAAEADVCGAQALAFARIRKLDNDLGRQNRQRRLLLSMFNKVKDCSIPEMIGVAKMCLEHVTTNLPFTKIVSLATGVLSHGIAGISMQAFPDEGEYKYDSADGVSKLIIDPEAGRQKIHGFIYQ
ncbi:MAG: LCP family protein [Clostridia bacterium]|nr:LCP family protein [Clostridia bacterium]